MGHSLVPQGSRLLITWLPGSQVGESVLEAEAESSRPRAWPQHRGASLSAGCRLAHGQSLRPVQADTGPWQRPQTKQRPDGEELEPTQASGSCRARHPRGQSSLGRTWKSDLAVVTGSQGCGKVRPDVQLQKGPFLNLGAKSRHWGCQQPGTWASWFPLGEHTPRPGTQQHAFLRQPPKGPPTTL